jgi:hypothetical protein
VDGLFFEAVDFAVFWDLFFMGGALGSLRSLRDDEQKIRQEQKKREQEQNKATTEADPYGMTNKRTGNGKSSAAATGRATANVSADVG